MAYASLSDFETYFEGFGTKYYGTKNTITGSIVVNTTKFTADLDNSYNKLNSILSSIGRIPNVPVGTNPKTGSYHPNIVEWNTIDTIYTKLRARHLIEYAGQFPEWMNYFGSRCNEIISGITSGAIAFDTDTVNTGIGMPIRRAGSGIATMYSNWDIGFYYGSDYPKIYRIKTSDFTNGSTIGKARFVVSADDGFSYGTDKYDTGTAWISIDKGLQIRFENGSGTNEQLTTTDVWSIETKPQNPNKVTNAARFKRFDVG